MPLSCSVTMTSLTMTSQFVDPWRLNFNFPSSFLVFKGLRVHIYKHTSFLTYLRQEYCLTCAAGGVGGLRGDVTGVGNPSDALENPSDDLGNPSDFSGTSKTTPPPTRSLHAEVDQDTPLYAFNRTRRLHKWIATFIKILTQYSVKLLPNILEIFL